MKQNYLQDQRGVAMLLELVLVAAVLGLVGVALYQSNHKVASNASVPSTKSTSTTAVGVANAAAAITESESAADTSLSASAESSADQTTEADVDVTNLGGSTGANSL